MRSLRRCRSDSGSQLNRPVTSGSHVESSWQIVARTTRIASAAAGSVHEMARKPSAASPIARCSRPTRAGGRG